MRTTVIREAKSWEQLGPRGYCRRPPIVGVGEYAPPPDIPRRTILLGDALEQLGTLPANSIDTIVTSPPYYALRDYAVDGQLGLEPNVDDWVVKLRDIFRETARVLKPAGSVWLDLGDAFSKHHRYGAPPKSMLCAPERLLLALVADDWIVRSKVIWYKPNALPNSVADRLNINWEVIYLLVRSPRYFFDLDAIREDHRSHAVRRTSPAKHKTPEWVGPLASGSQDGLQRSRSPGVPGHHLGKNPGSVWAIPTRGFRGPHFATFPPELIRRPILASCPEAICTRCGKPWRREVSVKRLAMSPPSKAPKPDDVQVMRFKARWHTVRKVGELIPCGCEAPTVPGVVLDPFMGAGTVGLVAEELRRDWLGIEIAPRFRDMSIARIEGARRGS